MHTACHCAAAALGVNMVEANSDAKLNSQDQRLSAALLAEFSLRICLLLARHCSMRGARSRLLCLFSGLIALVLLFLVCLLLLLRAVVVGLLSLASCSALYCSAAPPPALPTAAAGRTRAVSARPPASLPASATAAVR